MAINRKIIDKKGKLTPKEYEIMKNHTVLGYKMLENIGDAGKSPLLAYAREICRWHHERYDGKGYPDGLKGEEIPLSAQVVSVCDVYDALTSTRSYKPAYSPEKSLKMIIDGECGAFNPVLIECLVEAVGEYERTVENQARRHFFGTIREIGANSRHQKTCMFQYRGSYARIHSRRICRRDRGARNHTYRTHEKRFHESAILSEPLEEVQLGVAFKKGTHAAVIERLNQALAIMQANGFVARTRQKYGLDPAKYTVVGYGRE